MRTVLAILAMLVAGCASIRGTVAPPSAPVNPAGVESTVPPASGLGSGLGSFAHPRIDTWERRLRARGDATDSLARGTPYFPGICAILAEHGLPPELALLPAIESGFRPRARGRAGERGLWQLRRATARRFGLVVTARRDDRLHPDRATRAAADYLELLHARYGDWPLALAAYNAGERRVDRAVARARTGDFWLLAERGFLPRTSRDYVPRFLALVRMTELGSQRSAVLACSAPALKPQTPTPLAASPPPPRNALRSDRFRFAARKLAGPPAQTAEAGVAWSLTEDATIEVSYARNVFGDSVPRDPDDGVRTSVKVAF
jgi:hypothetical protein